LARDGGLAGQYASMPSVSSPDASAQQQRFSPANLAAKATGMTMHEDSYVQRVELRDAVGGGDERGHVLLWARLLDEPALTPAGVAFLADMVPVAIARAAGKAGAGVSLDNSMRFGPAADTEWVLLELSGDLASGGYGHGSLRAWATDGTLLATGSQTANMIYVAD
jgi:acyl-CoA thioesterase-2